MTKPLIKTVPELKAEEIITPLSVLDEYTDDEIQYWSTPYFDEIQNLKELHKKQLEEEAIKNGT